MPFSRSTSLSAILCLSLWEADDLVIGRALEYWVFFQLLRCEVFDIFYLCERTQKSELLLLPLFQHSFPCFSCFSFFLILFPSLYWGTLSWVLRISLSPLFRLCSKGQCLWALSCMVALCVFKESSDHMQNPAYNRIKKRVFFPLFGQSYFHLKGWIWICNNLFNQIDEILFHFRDVSSYACIFHSFGVKINQFYTMLLQSGTFNDLTSSGKSRSCCYRFVN